MKVSDLDVRVDGQPCDVILEQEINEPTRGYYGLRESCGDGAARIVKSAPLHTGARVTVNGELVHVEHSTALSMDQAGIEPATSCLQNRRSPR